MVTSMSFMFPFSHTTTIPPCPPMLSRAPTFNIWGWHSRTFSFPLAGPAWRRFLHVPLSPILHSQSMPPMSTHNHHSHKFSASFTCPSLSSLSWFDSLAITCRHACCLFLQDFSSTCSYSHHRGRCHCQALMHSSWHFTRLPGPRPLSAIPHAFSPKPSK